VSSISNVPKAITRVWIPSDGIFHAIEYGLLAWCTLMYFHTIHFTARQTRAAYIGAFFFSGFIGGLNELWQIHIPHRGPSGCDAVANMVGAAIFIGLFHLLKMRKVSKVN